MVSHGSELESISMIFGYHLEMSSNLVMSSNRVSMIFGYPSL